MTQIFYIVPIGATRYPEMTRINTDSGENFSPAPGDRYIIVSEDEARGKGGIEAFVETQRSWTGAWIKHGN